MYINHRIKIENSQSNEILNQTMKQFIKQTMKLKKSIKQNMKYMCPKCAKEQSFKHSIKQHLELAM